MLKVRILLLYSIIAVTASGQYFQTGQDPASLKWRQINTKNFQLIYPNAFETQAQKMANILEKVYDYGSYSLNHNPQKISVIFHTQTVKSNGLLAWAPRRVEMYTTPDQSMYAQDWLEQLAVHEFRHVVQVDKIAQNLPAIIPLLMAQQGAAFVSGAYLPFWFLEGDAVVIETALSKTGRGRFPSFLMENQAQVIEKGVYSFEKAYHGSYKDFVPDHYKLGYYLVGGARNYFGSEVWEKVVLNVGKKPFSLTPTNSALKKYTGLNQRNLYKMVFDSLRVDWLNQNNSQTTVSVKQISKPSKNFSNYKYNFFTPGDSLITFRSTFNSISQFQIIAPDGREKKILTPGLIFDESADLTGNLLTWSEELPDPRWEHSGKSLIHIFNIETKEDIEIKPEFKGFSPSVSPDKKMVSMVEVDFINNYFLSVYEIGSNKLLTRFQTADNNYLFTPRWLNENQLVCVILTNKGKVLALVDPFEGKIENLTNESLGEIKHPVVNGSDIYFISSYSGQNDLYVLTLGDKKVYRIYHSRFGVEYPAVSFGGNKIVVSDYTANGFRLIELPLAKIDREPIDSIEKGSYPLAEKLASQEKGVPDFSGSDSVKYTSEKYNKAAHLFHFHSWMPAYFDVNSYDIQPGVSFLSQNMLGTAETSFGYKWDMTEKTGKIFGKFTYKGWYPMLSAEVTNGKQASEYTSITNYVNSQHEIIRSDTITKRFSWGETVLNLNVWIPLNISKGKYFRLLQPELKYELTSRSETNQQPEWFVSGNINAVSYRLYFHQILKQSYQDLVPNFGVVLNFIYRHSPGGNLNLGNLTAFQMVNYLPGFMPNHGFVFYNGFQNRTPNNGYSFSDIIRYPRGWGKMLNNQMYSFSADYKLPLLYPDFSLGKFVYLKRLKASVYADYAYQQGNVFKQREITGQFTRHISGFGTEITGDMHFLRFYAPVILGTRIGYLPEAKQMYYGFLFSVDFTSF